MKRVLTSVFTALLLSGCSSTSSGSGLELAIADELDACADLPVGDGEAGRGEEMSGHAARLREFVAWQERQVQAFREGRPYETSFYLGFMPEQALNECAAAFRTAGRAEQAARAESLGVAYRAEQTAMVERIRREMGVQP